MPTTMSPFRYPGGKSQLYGFVQNLLERNNIHGTYIEAFAGGFGIGLKLLFDNIVESVVINDYDPAIYSVWWAILNHPDELINKIKSVPFNYNETSDNDTNLEFWNKQRDYYRTHHNDTQSLELAFTTLFLNRTNMSGIITGGPLGGHGQNKTKISARFNKQTLIGKIRKINSVRDRITLSNQDALEMIPKLSKDYNPQDTFIFFDPPYYEQGGNLYFSSLDDKGHRALAKEIIDLPDFNWIVTYDLNSIIDTYYASAYGRYTYRLNYSANVRGKAPEYMFTSEGLKTESFNKTILEPV